MDNKWENRCAPQERENKKSKPKKKKDVLVGWSSLLNIELQLPSFSLSASGLKSDDPLANGVGKSRSAFPVSDCENLQLEKRPTSSAQVPSGGNGARRIAAPHKDH